MLIVEVKDSDSIDRALKKYKRKVQQTGLLNEVKRRREFVKPSVLRRTEILKATYIQEKNRLEEEF